jgi:hypothetical protein
MTVEEIIAEIENLPAGDRARVASFLTATPTLADDNGNTGRNPSSQPPAQYMDSEKARRIASEVFTRNAELFRKLAQ